MAKPRQPPPASNRHHQLRCAIYTRKSSDEGLEQSFNSLDAQRDACEAFVTSQKHEGWVVLPRHYDDGGFSGGSMDRPALQSLLEEVSKGMVDVVVVYKVDRLTRSLADFAKLTELLDRHKTSFVSVTQQFNTSTSMGRLTLNVLLSFAQFEREVAGERIRDKIALSKRRGMWMGGLPPLGYDGIDRKLVINPAEADTVRLIFRRYLEVASIAQLKRSLDRDGILSKKRIFADGKAVGGVSLSRGAIYQILRNRLYRGEIAHRGESHKGNHSAIIHEDLWNAVQEKLAGQSGRRRSPEIGGNLGQANQESGPGGNPPITSHSSSASASPLLGLLFDQSGTRLTPTHAHKNGKRYRYYVSAPLTRGEKTSDGIRVPAPDLEWFVLNTMIDRLRDEIWLTNVFGKEADVSTIKDLIANGHALADSLGSEHAKISEQALEGCRDLIERIVVAKEAITLNLYRLRLTQALDPDDRSRGADASDSNQMEPIEISVPAQFVRAGKQVRLILGEVTTEDRSPDPDLMRLVTDARRWFEDLRSGRAATIADIAERDRVPGVHVSRTLPLAFLAPDIVEMILQGRQPPNLTPDRLKRRQSLPVLWSEQRETLLA